MATKNWVVVPSELHNNTVAAMMRSRGYWPAEIDAAVNYCFETSRVGNHTHNAIKLAHLDEHWGSGRGNWVPGAQLSVRRTRFRAAITVNANRRFGPAVLTEVIPTVREVTNDLGVCMLNIQNFSHALCGTPWLREFTTHGLCVYTGCVASVNEVVPFGGKDPTLGTNPMSWGLPTRSALGFDLAVDFATAVIAASQILTAKREGTQLPPNSVIDSDGHPTTDPEKVYGILTVGHHKGSGMSIFNELMAGFMGGPVPSKRCREPQNATGLFLMAWHPDAMSYGCFPSCLGRDERLADIIADIRSRRNNGVIIPGEFEERSIQHTEKAGGLLFTPAEVDALAQMAEANDLREVAAELRELDCSYMTDDLR